MIGHGGMGTVYLARDRKHGRQVAIKAVHSDLAAGVGVRRFQREIRITAGLQHPHILPLLDSGSAGETLFYVMPFIEGDSLRTRISEEEKLPPEDVVRIGRDVLEALAYAHDQGVVHRDIKPDNVLLGPRHAIIADFGIAKALTPTADDAITGTGWRVGSPAYMAPEQLAGAATPLSDLYSLGAVLYEALTGERWVSRSDLDTADWSGVPAQLRTALKKALAWLPEDRWPDAMKFRAALRTGTSAPTRGRLAAIGATAALLVAAATWLISVNVPGPTTPPSRDDLARSIAVLPLENLNGDDETEYFSDGITEDIIAQLSRIGELDVISRNSSMQYKDSEKSLQEIGDELNVSAVLGGSVRRDGDRVRIVSQLVDTRTDESLWAETYDRELTDVFAIQAAVAQEIAVALRATVSPAERSLIERRPTDDVEAHQLYLRGRYLWNRRTRAGLESAVDYFGQAAERDGTYAPAYAGLADAYLLLGSYRYMPETEAMRQTKVAAERAIELDPGLAEAWATRGQVLRSERDWEGEEAAYRRAIELNPNYATAHAWYATLLAALGRPEEAVAQIRRAESLDPLSHAIGVTAAVVHHVNRDYEAAVARLRSTLELDPEYFSAYAWLTMSYSEMGLHAEALAASEDLMRLRPDVPQFQMFAATVHARAGNEGRAREMLAAARREADSRTLAAWVHTALGDVDEAFELLNQEFEDDSWSMFVFFRAILFYMDEGAWFDPLRDDPRWDALMARGVVP